MPRLNDQQHREIAFWGLAMIAMGLPLSVFLVSVGTFVLAGNWLLEGDLWNRLQKFAKSPLSIALVSLFILHVAGLLWTTDLQMGLKDLRVKLPLLLMPLFLFTSKLPDRKRIQDILLVFVVACMVGVLFGMVRYFGLDGQEVTNTRHVSVFISHIRFGLMLVLCIYILLYLMYSKRRLWSVYEKILASLTILWALWFLVVMEAFTAYLALAVTVLASALWALFRMESSRLKGLISMAVAAVTLLVSFQITTIWNNHFAEVPFNPLTLTVRTLNGNYYGHEKDVLYRENGHRVWNFVCWDELRKEWPERSSLPLDSLDGHGQPVKFTAVRYMTSKGLKKDSAGVHQLTTADIANIERGFTNYRYTDRIGINRRIYQILWSVEEYSWNRNANNSSLMQRWVYAIVGWSIYVQHPVFGVGTGDIVSAYGDEYAKDSRGLEPRFQGISHNQFITVAVVLGTFGLIVFLLMLMYPAWRYRRDFLYVMFMLIMLVSFLTDNTFDRQSGVTLFAFFNALLIVRREFAET
ncbi:MAG: O-antigen ligase domain-containing protein [Bacteroidetes bacterium]|nr:MAG: O-antigen ligase domain-containing protein [Bacteroidota bacterium]